jgi:hypothetical protein
VHPVGTDHFHMLANISAAHHLVSFLGPHDSNASQQTGDARCARLRLLPHMSSGASGC